MDEVLAFWFADKARWWKKDPAFDAEVKERFGALHEAVTRGEHEAWRATARGALAYVIVLDQFPRNMFRGTPRAFASDDQARRATVAAIEAGFDAALTPDERAFLYMPLMHSESVDDQHRCVELFTKNGPADNIDYAVRHRDIVVRFGRFPHRNEILGRDSTAEEIEFLKQPGSSF